jgi:hypothetical protein
MQEEEGKTVGDIDVKAGKGESVPWWRRYGVEMHGIRIPLDT